MTSRSETTAPRHVRAQIQKGALGISVVFVLIGVLGFIPGITQPYAELRFASTSEAQPEHRGAGGSAAALDHQSDRHQNGSQTQVTDAVLQVGPGPCGGQRVHVTSSS